MFIEQLTNTGMLVLIFAVAVVITVILLTAAGVKPQIKMAIAGISIPVIILSAILLCSGGQITVWLTEQINNALGAGAAVAAPATTAPVRTSNVAPPSNNPSSLGNNNTPSGNATGNTSDRTEIFDLGSQVAGYFEDGVPYRLHEVQPRDTVYRLKNFYGVTEEEIVRYNNLDIRRRIVVGRTLKIPIH